MAENSDELGSRRGPCAHARRPTPINYPSLSPTQIFLCYWGKRLTPRQVKGRNDLTGGRVEE
jgi:hypothetical protein